MENRDTQPVSNLFNQKRSGANGIGMHIVKIINNMSIRWQLLLICFLFVTIPTVILGLLTYRKVKTDTLVQIEQRLGQQTLMVRQNITNIADLAMQRIHVDLEVAKNELYRNGFFSIGTKKQKAEVLNQVSMAKEELNFAPLEQHGVSMMNNFLAVDKIKSMVGGAVTIFQRVGDKLVRISTNVIKDDGSRAVGTYISSESPVYKAISKGETYYGRAMVINNWYFSAYEPIVDPEGQIVGALFVGVNEKDYQTKLLNSLAGVVVGKTGYVFILDRKGNYLLSYKQKRDGENILESKDANGVSFVKEIIDKAVSTPDSMYAIQYYTWKNKGENEARLKIAAVNYFRDWDWIVSASAYQGDFMDALKNIQRSTILICLIAIIIGSLLAFAFANYMANNFKRLVEKMSVVARGDLTVNNENHYGRNELGTMADAFGVMLENLKKLVAEIITNSNNIASTAEQLSASTEEVNATSEQINLSINEIAKGSYSLSQSAAQTKEQTDELFVSIQSVANFAHDSALKASQVNALASNGSMAARVANEKMEAIKSSVSSSTDIVKEMVTKSMQINKVIDVIHGISKQTNLLALNAAIEAARAGEAGKGFGVVAGAIRKLAEESEKSTRQIEGMILEIVKTVEDAVNMMNVCGVNLVENTTVVNNALASLDEISHKVMDLTSQIENISTATDEQMLSSERVQESIGAVSSFSEESAAASEEVATSIQETKISIQQVAACAQDLAIRAEELRTMVSQFKIDKKEYGNGPVFNEVKPSAKKSSKSAVSKKEKELMSA